MIDQTRLRPRLGSRHIRQKVTATALAWGGHL